MGRKKEPTTVCEFLGQLPDDIVVLALANAAEQYPDRLARPCESIAEALRCAFRWSATPEGADYWADLEKKYAKMEKGESA